MAITIAFTIYALLCEMGISPAKAAMGTAVIFGAIISLWKSLKKDSL